MKKTLDSPFQNRTRSFGEWVAIAGLTLLILGLPLWLGTLPINQRILHNSIPMGIQCVSESCEFQIGDDCDFCPACGADNRRPSARRKVPYHHHRFVIRSGYCVRCGEPADEPYSFGYRWRVRLVLLSILSGLLSFLTAGFIQLGHWQTNTLIGRWIANWYSNPVVHRTGRRYSSTTFTTELGHDLTGWFLFGGVGLTVLGILMLFKVPFSETSDESPRHWRSFRW